MDFNLPHLSWGGEDNPGLKVAWYTAGAPQMISTDISFNMGANHRDQLSSQGLYGIFQLIDHEQQLLFTMNWISASITR